MRRRKHEWLALWLWSLLLCCCRQIHVGVDAQTSKNEGDPLCPCLTEEAIIKINRRDADISRDDNKQLLQWKDYGVGCRAHDVNSPRFPECSDKDSPCAKNQNVLPATVGCDTSWCHRSWCYVDPLNCTLAHRRGESFTPTRRYWSYATCGDMDAFTSQNRWAALDGKVFRMGLNSNSGGWLGAYAKDSVHFEGPIDKWSGLALDYVAAAASKGRFQFEITEPPEFLWNRSMEYFQSTSKFDFCVYATSLGYLDMCIAQYTVTDQRASSTD